MTGVLWAAVATAPAWAWRHAGHVVDEDDRPLTWCIGEPVPESELVGEREIRAAIADAVGRWEAASDLVDLEEVDGCVAGRGGGAMLTFTILPAAPSDSGAASGVRQSFSGDTERIDGCDYLVLDRSEVSIFLATVNAEGQLADIPWAEEAEALCRDDLENLTRIASRQVGQALGLDSPCPRNETCPADLVESPLYPQDLACGSATPTEDDLEGIAALYGPEPDCPTGDGRTGPGRGSEYCACGTPGGATSAVIPALLASLVVARRGGSRGRRPRR